MKSTEKILHLLKSQGSMTARSLADELDMTTMGVRQHLLSLEQSQDVEFEDRKAPRGRPTRYWSLTNQSNEHFEDRHSELTLQLIDSVKNLFGDDGLDKLITAREEKMYQSYLTSLPKSLSLNQRLNILAEIRSKEGYMAAIHQKKDEYWLTENHCPICAAAKRCQNFCRSELKLFQSLFDEQADVSREEHIIEGARRCAYRFNPKSE